MQLSKIIKKHRDCKSLTIDQLSVRSDLSRAFISRIERGGFDKKNISLNSVIRLAQGLDIKVKEILDNLNVIEQNEPSPLRMYLRSKYKIDNEKDVRLIEDLIDNLVKRT
ncbi:MAG: helix-turn-helix transcriptional regulator [Patescibacteria group bacterium]|nr:helix-turn-helix transcriptional regulator [Patescibacteria group bacterium]